MASTKRNRISKQQLQRRIRRHKRAVLIINTHSRKGSLLYRHAKQLLQRGGFELLAAYPVKQPALINDTIAKGLAHKPDLLIIGSGDGTISEVVDHLAYSDTALGFIPLGTTNNFARSLGIPLSVDGAINVILQGVVEDIDLGKVNDDDYFANVASIGISVEVAAKVPHGLKRRLGRLAYALTGLRVMARHQPFWATIETAGKTSRLRTHQLVIANGRSHSGTLIARDASIDNKQLTIFRIGRSGRWQLVKGMLRFSFGQRRSTDEKDYLQAAAATITTDPVCPVEIDGEIKTVTPARFGIADDALYVMVPGPLDSRDGRV